MWRYPIRLCSTEYLEKISKESSLYTHCYNNKTIASLWCHVWIMPFTDLHAPSSFGLDEFLVMVNVILQFSTTDTRLWIRAASPVHLYFMVYKQTSTLPTSTHICYPHYIHSLPVGFPGMQHFRIINSILCSLPVKEIKQVFDGLRQWLSSWNCKNCFKKIINKWLQNSLYNKNKQTKA